MASGKKFDKLESSRGIVLLFLLALVLRFCCLGVKSLWFDEAVVLLEAQKSLASLFGVNSEGIHPPLYRLIMHFWIVLGKSEWLVRLPSLIFGGLAVVAGYKTASLVFNKRVALYTAFFIAVSPFQIYYGQEVKGYTLFFLLSLASLYSFLRAVGENRNRFWIIYVITTSLSTYLHYFGFLNILAQIVFMIANHREYGKKALARMLEANLAVFVLFWPWLFFGIEHFNRVIGNFWIPPVSPSNASVIFINFLAGYYASNLNLTLIKILVIWLSASGLFWMFARKEEAALKKKGAILILSYLLVPAIILAFSKLVRPVYLDRSLIFIAFFFYIILAQGLDFWKKNKTFMAFSAILLIISLGLSLKDYYTEKNFRSSVGVPAVRKHFRQAAAFVGSKSRLNEIIIISHYSAWPSFKYYLPGSIQGRIYLEGSANKGVNEDYSAMCVSNAFDIKRLDLNGIKGAGTWIICSDWGDVPFISPELKEWMDTNKERLILKNDSFKGVTVYYLR